MRQQLKLELSFVGILILGVLLTGGTCIAVVVLSPELTEGREAVKKGMRQPAPPMVVRQSVLTAENLWFVRGNDSGAFRELLHDPTPRAWLSRPECHIGCRIRRVAALLLLMRLYSGEELLKGYAATIDMGPPVRGLYAAAAVYFRRDLRTADLPTAAALAGMIAAPGYFSPLRFPDRCLGRRNAILLRMLKGGVINKAQYAAAHAAPLFGTP